MSLPSTAAWASPSVMALTSWPSIGWRTWGADGADVNETSNDVHGEWLWMALNRDSWWADGLGCNENVEFISVMILAENLMNDWNHLILSCLNSLNFSFFWSGVLSTSHKSSLPEGYNGPKMQMLYEVYWSMIMFSHRGTWVYTRLNHEKGGVFWALKPSEKTCDIRPGCRCSLYPTEENSKAFSKFCPVALQQLAWLIRGWILMDALTLLCQRFNRWY